MTGSALRPLVVLLFVSACTRGEAIPGARPDGGPPPGAGREPVVRVGITVDSATAGVSAAAPFTIDVPGGSVLVTGERDETFVFRAEAGRLVARSDRGRTIGAPAGMVRVSAANDTVLLSGRAYRGAALVRAVDDAVTAINVLDMEAYLLGVVPREMGRRPESEIEALKAQAIAARTYAVGNMGGRSNRGFDFFATVADQVYGGAADEDPIVSRAVRETRGEILTHAGRPILAYYSSTCGGRTAAIEDSWPWRAPLPYLRSVSDAVPGTDAHYCDGSSRFRWQQSWTREELLDVLGETLRAYAGGASAASGVTDVRLTDDNASRRRTVEIVADGRTYTVRADSVRRVLALPGGALLNSSMIERLDVEHAEDGTVSALAAHGGGWGHAIGMCQVGAMGRARAGHSYRQILMAYYTGADIERVY